MKTCRPYCLLMVLLSALLVMPAIAQKMPKEDVIDVPAIGEGLWVSNTFQSNMVLQRDKPIFIWGWADSGEAVTVNFAGNSASATADKERAWKVELPAVPANAEPQTLTIKGKSKTLTLDNILVGDVWILSGQSNMEFELAKVENGNLEIISANYPQIRVLTVPQNPGPMEETKAFPRLHEYSSWSSRHFRKGDWDVCTPEIARELSAIGFVFARRIHQASGVPIGVIDLSQGGTTVETWTPLDALRKMDSEPTQAWLKEWDDKVAAFDPQADLQDRIAKKKDWLKRMAESGREISPEGKVIPSEVEPGPIADKNHPGHRYARMLKPLEGLSVKGTIWHQGYNNALGGLNAAEMYADVFPVMIASWRAAFNDAEMPFGILTLCTAGAPQTLDDYSEQMLNGGIDIRAVQYKTFEDLYKAGDKNIGLVSTYDLRRTWYHPQLKLPAGERAARSALATQYGFDREIQWRPPMVKDMEATDGSLTLSFDTTVQDPVDGEIVGFAIAGADRKFYPAKANFAEKGKDDRGRMQYDKTKLTLTSIMVPEPIHFRYAWGRNPLANLQASGNKDLPLGTQRSDDWPTHTVPLDVLPEDVKLPLERGDTGKLRQALRDMDQQRKLAEAQQVVKELTQE